MRVDHVFARRPREHREASVLRGDERDGVALIVSERTAEIGIRLALGAQPGAVLRTVVVQGITLAAMGVVAGLATATAFMPLVRTQLYGIRPLDPPTLLGVPAILIAIAALACFVPARRAMSIDPVDALRN